MATLADAAMIYVVCVHAEACAVWSDDNIDSWVMGVQHDEVAAAVLPHAYLGV